MLRIVSGLTLALALTASGCVTMKKEPIVTVSHVDLTRFMGPWYVIANIPTFLEKNAYNPVEAYTLNPDGTIAVNFSFHKGSFDGPLKVMHPKGFVRDASNALWGMQFLWPIKAEYRISYLNEDYSQTIIARTARDYVWILARTPQLSPGDYQHLVDAVGKMGYDTSKLVKQPQRWP